MARNRKKRKSKKGGNSSRIRVFDTELELQNHLGTTMLKSIKEEFELLETDFGPIKVSDGAVAYSLKNKGAFMPIATIDDRIDGEDNLELLLEYERLNQEFPKEPFINVQIADCYKHLKEEGKYEAKLVDNFSKYKGDPLVDIEYFKSLEGITPELYESIFGTALNIHEQYASHKTFDPYTVQEFYAQKTNYYIERKEYEVAKNCIEVVKQINVNEARLLYTMLAYSSDPVFRRRTKLMTILVYILLLAILVGVLWGIVRLFRWLF